MAKYLFEHPRGGFRYQRRVPKDIQALFGKRFIIRYIPPGPKKAVEDRVTDYAAQDKRMFDALAKTTHAERADIIHKGGWAGYQAFPVGSDLGLKFVEAVAKRRVDAGDGDFALVVLDAQHTAANMRAETAFARKTLAKCGATKGGASLDSLVDIWERVTEIRNPRTPEKTRRSMRLLTALLGEDTRPADVTAEHIADFRDHNEAQGMTLVMQQRHLIHLNAVFNAAVNERALKLNPAKGISARKARQRNKRVHSVKKREPFTGAQLRIVLEKAAEMKWGGKRHNDALWILKLLAYSGARPNEICQLRKEDVQVVDGVPVLVLQDADDGQSLKTDASVRNVPLHPACIGFLDYAAKTKGPFVFGSMTHYKEGARAGWIIRHFKKLRVDVCKITDPKVVLYSMRHHFVDAMRDAGVPEDRRHAIVGHREPGVHGRYGRGTGLKALAAEIAKVDPLA